jgi:hypothetical protein
LNARGASVRFSAIKVLGGWAEQTKEAAATLEKVATQDERPQLQELASSFLHPQGA